MIYENWLDGKYITYVHLKIGEREIAYFVQDAPEISIDELYVGFERTVREIAITRDGKFIVVYFRYWSGLEMIPIHCVQTIRWREVEDEV